MEIGCTVREAHRNGSWNTRCRRLALGGAPVREFFSGKNKKSWSTRCPLHLLHHLWPIDICCVFSHRTVNAMLGQNAATRKCSKVCQLSCSLSIGRRPVLSAGGPVTKYADSHQWQVEESVAQRGLWLNATIKACKTETQRPIRKQEATFASRLIVLHKHRLLIRFDCSQLNGQTLSRTFAQQSTHSTESNSCE